jgi:hypothetical protein
MSRFNPNCFEDVNHSKIVFEENRSKIIFNNPQKAPVCKVTVDSCQITEGIRCDFLLVEPKKEHYIELKGEDIEHAVEQLSRSIKELSPGPPDFSKASYIISARSPLSSPEIQILKAKFKRNFNSELIIKNRVLEVVI